MERLAEDFGNAGVVRFYCDADGCGKPLRMCFRGRAGDYCSVACLKRCDAVRIANGPRKVTGQSVTGRKVTDDKVTGRKVTTVRPISLSSNRARKVTGSRIERKVTPLKVTGRSADAASSKVTGPQKVTGAPMTRRERGIARRKLMAKVRAEFLTGKGREPSISEIQRELAKYGQPASHRTVWIDLKHIRSGDRAAARSI